MNLTAASADIGNFISHTSSLQEKESLSIYRRKTVELDILIPSNWNNTSINVLTIEIGEFSIESRSSSFKTLTHSKTDTISRVYLIEDFSEEKDSSESLMSLYSQFSPIYDVTLLEKVFLTLFFALIIAIYIAIFVYKKGRLNSKFPTTNIDQKFYKDYLKNFLVYIRATSINSKYYLWSSLFFSFTIFIYLISYSWYGQRSATHYASISCFIAATLFLVYLIFTAFKFKTKQNIFYDETSTLELNAIIREIDKFYEVSFRETYITIVTLVTLFLFIYGGSSLQNIWFF